MAAAHAAGRIRTMPMDILVQAVISPTARAPDKLPWITIHNDSSRYCNHELGVEYTWLL
ncbi:hypothetical protein [Paenibacillus lautus]|uniref:hypothetical protein n=1 Tax=Paenibacillus lautus TaxID=1401 RepID=UPI003D287CF5